MIKNVIFDIGMVLISFDWDGFLTKLYGEKAAEVISKATWGNPTWSEFDRAVWSFDEVVDSFVKTAPEYESEIREALRRIGECPEKQPYAIPWVEELKAAGYRVYFLSNYFEYLENANRGILDFIPHMDGGVFSYQIHMTKPSAEIYDYICRKYDLSPGECLFIDDSAKNVAGARAFGMESIQFIDYETTYPVIKKFLGGNG